MKIYIKNKSDIENYRGMTKTSKSFKVYGWECLSKSDLSYFLNSILGPHQVPVMLVWNG